MNTLANYAKRAQSTDATRKLFGKSPHNCFDHRNRTQVIVSGGQLTKWSGEFCWMSLEYCTICGDIIGGVASFWTARYWKDIPEQYRRIKAVPFQDPRAIYND